MLNHYCGERNNYAYLCAPADNAIDGALGILSSCHPILAQTVAHFELAFSAPQLQLNKMTAKNERIEMIGICIGIATD